jgi:hypothetical protein
MGLSLHVMPLWKFWAGQIPESVIAGMPVTTVRVRPLHADPEQGKSQERAVMESLRARDARIVWSQEDKVACSEQFPSYDLWHALRAFAAHETFPLKKWFRPQPSQEVDDWSKHLCLTQLKLPTEYAYCHLIFHADRFGWYLPAEFSQPISDDGISIGSSVKLALEFICSSGRPKRLNRPSFDR